MAISKEIIHYNSIEHGLHNLPKTRNVVIENTLLSKTKLEKQK